MFGLWQNPCLLNPVQYTFGARATHGFSPQTGTVSTYRCVSIAATAMVVTPAIVFSDCHKYRYFLIFWLELLAASPTSLRVLNVAYFPVK